MSDAIPAELMTDDDATDAMGRSVMSDLELEGVVELEVMDAVSFIDSEIGQQRAAAIDYYKGQPLGNEEEGRSQIVSRDVADTINAVLPSLMRIFFGPEHVVEFVPETQDDEAAAAQQTDYINYIVTRDNDGFEIFYAVLKNALREKCGVIKYWWDDSIEVRQRRYTGLDLDSLTKLLQDIGGSIEAEITEQATNADGTLDVTLKLKKKRDRACIAALPPEEFLINRDAKSIDTARLVAHRRDMTVSDLVAMGYDREFVETHAGQEDDLRLQYLQLARNPYAQTVGRAGASNDRTVALVRYVEAYVTVDQDGDGIAELLKVCTIGGKIAHWEVVDERPFADFHCDPEPHTFFGESLADKTMDIQRWKSSLVRAAQDSLASSIFPRMKVTERANVDDVQNTEVGALIRVKDQSDVEPLVTPDVSPAALGWLNYADQVRENRTGMSRVSMGLDAEALQNTTATAAEGQFTRSQERIELIARIMASGFRRLFRGLSNLVAANQREARVVQLRNQWVEIDPRAWKSDMDVQPNVGLGGGTDQHKASILTMVMQTQAGIFQQYGLNNPFCTVGQYLQTVGTFLELAGFKNPTKFFNDPGQAEQMLAQKQAEAAQQPPPPDPKMVEAQGKMQLAQEQAQGSAQLEQAKAQAQIETQREKNAGDLQLQREKMAQEFALKREQMHLEIELKAQQLAMEAKLREQQMQMDAKLDAKDGDDSDDEDLGEVEFGGNPG